MNSPPMSDKGEPVVFKAGESDQVRPYTYVDNLRTVSDSESLVRQGLNELEKVFTERGFLLHPDEI